MSAFELNEEQAFAAASLDGPLVVAAGAGSGKTRVLTERIANAIAGTGGGERPPVALDRLLAITFTDKAAGELAERVRGALRSRGLVDEARRIDSAWISTIHGMCARLIRARSLELGLDPAFRVADRVMMGQMEEEAFEEAARELLETDGGVSSLFAECSFESVAANTSALVADLKTHRADVDAITWAPSEGSRLVDEAIDFLAEMQGDLKACKSEAGDQHDRCCHATHQALVTLRSRGVDEDVLLVEALRHLSSHEMPRPSKGAAEQIAELKAGLADLKSRVAGSISAGYAEPFLRLCVAYAERLDARKSAAGVLDFDDLQLQADALIASEHGEDLRHRFDLTMVDEFQDTDALQLRVVSALGRDQLAVVGDERQSIYRFRGADVSVYRDHVVRARRDGAPLIELTRNYRSHGAVLDFVNRLFGAPTLFGDDLLVLEHGRVEPEQPRIPADAARVELLVAPTTRSEGSARARLATSIAERIARVVAYGAVGAGEVAVLLPTYTHAEVYADALRAQGIGAVIIGGRRFFENRTVCALIAFLRVVANLRDEEAVGALLASAAVGLSDDALLSLRRATTSGAADDLWDALEKREVPDQERPLAELVNDAVKCAAADQGREPLSRLLLRAVENLGLDLRMLSDGVGGAQDYASVLKLVRMADEFEAGTTSGVAAFLAHLDAKQRYREHEAPASLVGDGSDAVTIMSIHASKGLEFPVVAVPELGSTGRSSTAFARWSFTDVPRIALKVGGGDSAGPEFESLRQRDAEHDDQETKRLFYVACTRAQEMLILAGARTFGKSNARTMLNLAIDGLGVELQSDTCVRIPTGPDTAAVVTMLGSPAESETEVPTRPVTGADGSIAEWVSTVRGHVDAGAEPGERAPSRLSYSGVGSYLRCPKRFRWERVLGAGGAQLSVDDFALRLGTAVHAVLQLFGETQRLDEERIETVRRANGLDAVSGQRVRVAVDRYRASDVAARVAACPSARREVAFALSLADGDETFVLDGAIDVYARDGERALIVDFKTGAHAGTAAELEEKHRLQAECYALAAFRDGAKKVEAVFVMPECEDESGVMRRAHFEFDADRDERHISETIAAVHRRMRSGDYPEADADHDPGCAECSVAAGECSRKAALTNGAA